MPTLGWAQVTIQSIFRGIVMNKYKTIVSAVLVVMAAGAWAQTPAPNFTGSGGKGISLTILAPSANGLAENQNYLPALVQGEFVSNFSGYSAISVRDREHLEEEIYRELTSPSYDDKEVEKLWDLGRLTPTTHFMGGKITKTATGYALQMNITKTGDKTTSASYSGTFTFAELDNLTGIRRASLDLLQKMGVALSAKATEELAGAAAESRVNAQTALAKGVTAQREKSEVAALGYYFQAAAFDPTLMEAANRSSKLAADITSGNMGENIRNDIQWRKDWVARLTEAEQFLDNFKKTVTSPYALYYSDDIQQGKVNYKTETVDLSIEAFIIVNRDLLHPIERAMRAVYNGLDATKRKGEWELSGWPRSSVTDLYAFGGQGQIFSVLFELLNNRNEVIGRSTLSAGSSWKWSGGRPQIEIKWEGRKTVKIINVNANDITDKMTIRVASVNGVNAEIAAKNGSLQIMTLQPGVIRGADLKDSRDGKSYRTVKIGYQTWMAENLNYNAVGSKYNPANGDKYGRLYDKSQAQSACPAGWHLPNDVEWTMLTDYVGGRETAGKKLKSTSGWNDNKGKSGNGTDDFGFSALPGGEGTSRGRFDYAMAHGYWWSATDSWRWSMGYDREYVGRFNYSEADLFSVRCLQD